MDNFTVGDRCLVHHLESDAGLPLNGQHVTLAYAIIEKGRFKCKFDDGSFACINNHLFTNQDNVKEYVNKVFSSPKSGIINPAIDKNWKEKVDKYMDYICKKREVYKSWFIDTRKPKQEKK